MRPLRCIHPGQPDEDIGLQRLRQALSRNVVVGCNSDSLKRPPEVERLDPKPLVREQPYLPPAFKHSEAA
jgi:hypothetical protein